MQHLIFYYGDSFNIGRTPESLDELGKVCENASDLYTVPGVCGWRVEALFRVSSFPTFLYFD